MVKTFSEFRSLRFKNQNRSKFNAVRTQVGGHWFASKREASRYVELERLARLGLIENLVLQPRFLLLVNQKKVGTYVGDFQYLDTSTNALVVEDVKSPATVTPIYRLKKKLVEAIHGITIREVF